LKIGLTVAVATALLVLAQPAFGATSVLYDYDAPAV
jgi:hypothetical protein